MTLRASRLALAAALLGSPLLRADTAPAARPAPAAAPSPIWEGTSAGFAIRWDAQGLAARDAKGAAVFDAQPIVKKDFADFDDSCEKSEAWAVLSVAGSLLSVQQNEGASCAEAAHGAAYADILAVDLSQPGKPPSLADYFSEADLYAALTADGVVKKTLAAANLPAPKTVAELLKLLAGNSNDCDFRFEEATLTHFAFHHLEKGKVAVRLGLPYGCEAARGKLTQLGLLLPIPERLKAALAAAAAKKEGFLMKDAKAVAGGRAAEFHAAAVPQTP